ncbi:MAG: hypothetical protein NC926_01155 [Candidatus Omnitrophica bacterium]|nr:hypothetical protein [Candidatus Omnitrophota bacterium]
MKIKKNFFNFLVSPFIFLLFFNFLSAGEKVNSFDTLSEQILNNLEEFSGKFGNKRLTVIVQYSSPDLIKISKELENLLIKKFLKSEKFEIVDSSFLGIKNITEINVENSKKWFENLNLGYILILNISKPKIEELQIDWRIIYLKDLTILTKDISQVKFASPLVDLKTKIENIKSSNVDKKKKEEEIVKIIAEFCKPNPEIKYTYTYFPCNLALELCRRFNLKEGFYKIYYEDEFVITVDKEGNIIESYYFGKNHPVRKDIDLEEFLKERR